MKRFTCLLSVLIICCFLCSCDPSWFDVDGEALTNNVVSIELIEYKNSNQKHFSSWVPDQFHKLLPFESANATVLETLPTEKMPDFLDSFSKSYILDTYYAYNSPKDICIRLNYANGDFLIVWADYAKGVHAGYIGEYSSDGKVLSFWGSFDSLSSYENLVTEYFSYSLK